MKCPKCGKRMRRGFSFRLNKPTCYCETCEISKVSRQVKRALVLIDENRR